MHKLVCLHTIPCFYVHSGLLMIWQDMMQINVQNRSTLNALASQNLEILRGFRHGLSKTLQALHETFIVHFSFGNHDLRPIQTVVFIDAPFTHHSTSMWSFLFKQHASIHHIFHLLIQTSLYRSCIQLFLDNITSELATAAFNYKLSKCSSFCSWVKWARMITTRGSCLSISSTDTRNKHRTTCILLTVLMCLLHT